MLTRDLLRFQLRDGEVVPKLLRATPANVDLAERLIAFWAAGVGQRRGELEDAVMPVMHQSRALVVARGFNKLILDGCTFAEAASAAELRTRAFAASALLLSAPAITSDDHAGAVAAAVGLAAMDLRTQLYGDLPDFEVLEQAPQLSAARLIERYNLALCQGLLLTAKSLRVSISDADVGVRRRLLKALRFRRLLAEVLVDAEGILRLDISGPGSVLDQASRYGLQLAQFLPALACAGGWRAEAQVTVSSRITPRATGTLRLSHELGLVGDSAFLGFVPPELRDLERTLVARFPDWTFREPTLMTIRGGDRGGELVVPDLEITTGGRTISVELFHRWHGASLVKRIGQLERGEIPHLAIGVERALARSPAIAPLIASAGFVRHGFQFNDIPSPRALAETVERLAKT
ncbi:MAG: DUF790 family protein [Planctomycetes bacterium]|nr:DUF790 family protein [Planctomycetota bacterium]